MLWHSAIKFDRISFFLMTIKSLTFVSYTFFVNTRVALTPDLKAINTLIANVIRTKGIAPPEHEMSMNIHNLQLHVTVFFF